MKTIITMTHTNYAGGVDRKVEQLIVKLLEKGWEVHHISPAGFHLKHKNFYHYPTKFIKGIFPIIPFFPQALIQVFKISRKKKIDVLFISEVGYLMLIGLFYKKFCKNTKFILDIEGNPKKEIVIDQKMPLLLCKIVYRFISFIEARSLQKADFIIFTSYDTKKKYHKYKLCKNEVFYSSIDKSWFLKKENLRKNYALGNKKIILFVGRHEKIKGINYLIKAFGNIRKKLPCSLIICGKGSETKKLKNLCKKLGLRKDVIFAGWVENLLGHIEGSDLIILPSLFEGSPVTILEAFFCNTPIIASSVGGIPEMLEHKELLFEPRNEKEIAEKVIKTLSDKEEYKKIKKLCAQQKKKFNYDWAEKLKKLFENQILGEEKNVEK